MSRTGVEDKPTWRSIPADVRAQVAQTLGAEVTRATRIWGGYGPSPTFRLTLADGRRAFFKGCGPGVTDFLRDVVLTEERVYRELEPYISPWAPQLLGAFHDGGWHVLLLEDVGPKTAPPWTPALTRRVLQAYAEYHAASIGAALPAWLPRFCETEADVSWRRILSETDDWREIAALVGPQSAEARRWLLDLEPTLAPLLARLPTLRGPMALLHLDTRSDNLRLTDGQLRLFDWPAVEVGPVEFDVVAFAQSITVEGGPQPEECLEWYGAELRPDLVDVALAWCVAFFALRAWQPPIPGLPRLRGFQRRQLSVLLNWAARRWNLPAPHWTAALLADTQD